MVKVTLQEYVSGNWEDVESWETLVNGSEASIYETYLKMEVCGILAILI